MRVPFQAEVIDGDILTVLLRGDLDSTSAPEFDRIVQEHLDKGRTKIIVDCRNLGYISSLGLGSLVALQARLRRKGGEVKLASVLGPVMEVMKAVRMDKMLEIYGDLEFARQAFAEDDRAAETP
ncbi:MAG: STAS domain-containing protein [Planctomycetaceae bacterium]|nr:STAS domain-containing protein [Planctomycetaceae bacterium]